MRRLIYAIAAVGALAWSSAAWAVLRETTVTLTDHGEPLPNATITLNRLTDSEPPPEPKTEETDESGKIVLVHEEDDKQSDVPVDLIITTHDGKTLTRRIVLRELLTSETIDVAALSETHVVAVEKECEDVTTLDDEQLRILLGNPELRERIVKLIEETEETEQTETEKATPSEADKAKETVSGKSKEKEAVQKKPKKQPTATASRKKGLGAAEVLGTGLSIGLGIAGSHHGHGEEHHRPMD